MLALANQNINNAGSDKYNINNARTNGERVLNADKEKTSNAR